MQMKLFLYYAFTGIMVCTVLNACNVVNRNQIKGSGHIVKEERTVPAFHKIKVEGSIDVYLSQGAAKPAVIEAEDNIIPLVEIVEEDGKLIIRQRRNTHINTRKSISVYLTTPDVDEAGVSGSGDIKLVDKFNAKEKMILSLSGSGNISGQVNAPLIKASITGSGDMSLRGESRDLSLTIAGSGDFKGTELLAENVNVNIAGSGNADVYASVSLDVKVAGSGDVRYKGSPQISSSIAGSGSVTKK
ncbi:head GIN domain-containing protein [Chitinophaga nivalis]|uniref:DUF2807 domain-containing protein n=1 Tax=Chitinophaga nivalis TaxID=2991709 RepID=A0ABT3ISQ0_9BACT|nr:head GIN domain-containing protein [Chitinophaga nivalis]MCW3463389.1 DUF2807 domain-containing protein [Chitinophaga nivalis]MCW3486921.1 DUF2807 domain-containing protein [Chitinophaga nivalis]